MNSEIKRKFCGLIMFDVPTMSVKSPKSKNNDDLLANNISATRDMIPPYESLNNINGSLINHQNGNNQMIIQNHNNNNDSDFSNTSQALAAGAAASQDDYNASLSSYSNYNNYNNGNNNNNEGNNDQCDNNNGGNNGKTTQQKRTPRPPNAFILYRRAKQPGIIAAQKHLTNAEVSRQISDMWRSESEEIRLNWERYADRKKLEHMQTYPNYVYRPNKNKSKVDKRRQRRQTSMSSSKDANNESLDNNNNNNNNNNKSTDGNNNNNTNTGPVRRKSKNNKAPIKVEINSQQMNYDIINRYNMQLQQINDSNNPNNNNYVSPTSTSATATPSTATTVTLLPSPEISLLASHFNHQPQQQQHHQQHHHQEIVPSQNTATPLTPITPPRQQAIINDNELKFRQQQQQQQQQQGNLPTYVPSNGHHIALPNQDLAYPFNGLTTFHQAANEYHPHQTIDPLELCFVPDVAQQQQQMLAEIMLHHDQHPHPQHHDSPDSSSPPSSSSSPSPIQYFTNGTTTAVDAAVNSVLGNHQSSFDVFTGLEFQNHYLSGGSVNQGNNGLATTLNTNQQQQYLH